LKLSVSPTNLRSPMSMLMAAKSGGLILTRQRNTLTKYATVFLMSKLNWSACQMKFLTLFKRSQRRKVSYLRASREWQEIIVLTQID
jgi:hypothetical protein